VGCLAAGLRGTGSWAWFRARSRLRRVSVPPLKPPSSAGHVAAMDIQLRGRGRRSGRGYSAGRSRVAGISMCSNELRSRCTGAELRLRVDRPLMSRQSVTASIRLPYPPYLWRVIRRSVGIWLLARNTYVVVLMVGVLFFNLLPLDEGLARVLHPGWATRAVLVTVATFVVWWDRRRSHEVLLPANLGAWSGWFWTASLVAALASDVAVQTLIAAL
jgi:hypothetical protein